jgi:phage-related baseplate assembly protein
MIDLTALPDIAFCETDAAAVQAGVLADYQAITGRTLYPGDPERLFLEGLAYVIALQRFVIDYTGKMNLLRYSAGDFLDHLGAMTGVARLLPSAASTTVRFSLGAPQASAVPIPDGTRVTPDGTLLFATTTAVEIPAGALSVEVTAQALTTGAAGNGFLAGQINQLVDPCAGVTAAANTTTSLGGSDAETDGSLRERIQLSPESFSIAGPRLAYVFWVKSTHQDILDAAVSSPTPGVVDVRVLATGGVLPSVELIEAVRAQLTDAKRRPLTDQVLVAAPEAIPFDLSMRWFVPQPQAALAAQIQTAVSAAVDGWVAWQRSKIGRDINPSELIRRVMAAGAKRVEVTSPAFTALTATQVAQPDTLSVVYGGVEDE